MQVRKEKGSTGIAFPQDYILINGIANVSPHGQIFDEHFEKIVVVNGFLEFGEIFGIQFLLAQETPVDTVHETNFVGRCFATVSHNGFSHALFVTDTAFALGRFG